MNLSKLIVEDRKLKEVDRLRKNQTQVRRFLVGGRGKDDIGTILMSTKLLNFVRVVVGYVMLLPSRH